MDAAVRKPRLRLGRPVSCGAGRATKVHVFADPVTRSFGRSTNRPSQRRLRAIAWKQWKHGRARFAELRRRGVGRDLAAQTAGSPHGPWRLANSPALNIALPTRSLRSLGLAPVAVPRSA